MPVPIPDRDYVEVRPDQAFVPAGTPGKVKVGDRIRVRNQNGVTRHFQVSQVTDEHFIGISFGDQKPYRITFADLVKLEVERKVSDWSVIVVHP